MFDNVDTNQISEISTLYSTYALRILVFAMNSSRNDEKVIGVVERLYALKTGVVWTIKCDLEIRLEHVTFV
jgi:hypothetical protein